MKRFLLFLSLVISMFAAQAQITKIYTINAFMRLARINSALVLQVDTSQNGNGWVTLTSSVYINGLLGSKVDVNSSYSNPPWLTALAGTKITQDATHRFATDAEKAIWNAKQDALGFTPVPNTRTVNGKALSGNISITSSDVGLGNVPNVDATNPANITQSASYRFATDAEKSAWNAKQAALANQVNIKSINNQTLLGSGDLPIAANLSIGTRTATVLPILNSLGVGINLPVVDGSYAGLATPEMYAKYLEMFQSTTIRNATTTNAQKISRSPNDSTILLYNFIFKSTNGSVDVDTTQSDDSTITVDLSVSAGSVDATPTNGSNNAVSSDGVYDALQSKANLASPTFTGTPAAPTAAAGTNTTQLATTAYVFAERTNTATLTNKTLTSPVINSPTGIVKGDVGLGNVDNTSDATKNSATATLTNKRWVARVGSTTSSATPTINTDNVDIYKLTAQAADITSFTTNLSGTPNDGDVLEIQITGTASRAITWGASFVSSTVTLPTTTSSTATLTVIFQYYTTSSYGNNKWVCANSY